MDKEILTVLCQVGYELAITCHTLSPIGRARYERAHNPQARDLVIETSTGGGRLQDNFPIAVGYYVKREKVEFRHPAPDEAETYFEDITTIRTFDGKEVTWENCRFVTILPHEGWNAVKCETRHYMPEMSWFEPDTRLLQAMLAYAKARYPESVPEIERRIMEASLSAGVQNFRPEEE